MSRPFSAKARSAFFRACEETPFDLIVVGGGITGAGILRDAASRGLNAALFEQEDFGYGTSSRSSKLIHGGLRYLETLDLRLIFEANRERRILLRTAPSLVKPLPFLIPVYRGQRRGLFMVGAGVWLYDFLSLFRNVGHPQIRSAAATLAQQPDLRSTELRGSALYYDAITMDGRLTMATLKSAHIHGAIALNHARVKEGIWVGDRLAGVVVRDRLTNKKHSVRARWVVNATGPWSDLFRTRLIPSAEPTLRLTKGVHVTLKPNRLVSPHAILMFSPKDGRVTFLIPWENHTILGTTDTDFSGDPATVSATPEDVDYLLETANAYFPKASLSPKDCISSWAGIRPLLHDKHDVPSNVSREHRIFSDAPGLLTVAGGKLTTFRRMAEELVDDLIHRTPEWQGKFGKSQTARSTLEDRVLSEKFSAEEIRYLIHQEMAATLSDILARRRSSLLLSPDLGKSWIDSVVGILAEELGYATEDLSKQKREYLELVHIAQSGIARDSTP